MQGRRPPPLHEPIRKISSKPKNTTRGGLRRFCRVATANTIENPRSAHFSPVKSMLLNGVTQNANRKIGVPGENQNGEPGGSPFQRFFLSRRGVYWRLWRHAPRARCDGSCLCSKPGGVILASAAFRTTIPLYSCAPHLARAPLQFSLFRN